MKKTEKEQIFSLLKTVSAYLPGSSPKDFSEDAVFEDDICEQIFAANNEKTEAPDFQYNTGEDKTVSLNNLSEKIASCQRCVLAKTRTKTVPGCGVCNPLVLVIGEGPGFEEDRQGLPFVGPAGKLLDKMLFSIQLSRNVNVYIANIVKCRPPQNRNPYPEEADACSSFLQSQIAILKPKAILCAGSVAAQNLLKTSVGVTKLRGSFFDYSGIPAAVTFHPSALLRDPSLKALAWEDLKFFRHKLLSIQQDYQMIFQNSKEGSN